MSPPPENIGHVWRVKPGRAAEYRERHATVWPEVEALLREYGVRKYTIYAWGEILFSHMEVDDYLRLSTEYGRDPIAERWEHAMGDLLEYPNADPVSGWPERLTEVWSL